jgi:NADH-quinone oxidoreductase subunit K
VIDLPLVLIFSALLFACGVYGVLARRNAVLVLMSIELMLNSVNVNLVAFSQYLKDAAFGGQIFALFVICVAAAEVGIGLAIVILIFRNRETINVDEVNFRWPPRSSSSSSASGCRARGRRSGSRRSRRPS